MDAEAPDERQKLKNEIHAAFAGVGLGHGVSLSQAEVRDRLGKDRDGTPVSDAQYARLKAADLTDDWTSIPLAALERTSVAHLDAEGLRYYLPALMISVLDHYHPGAPRVIGTLAALDPRPTSGDHNERYALLSDQQRRVIARFLASLPTLLALDRADGARIRRAMAAYWHTFLSPARRGTPGRQGPGTISLVQPSSSGGAARGGTRGPSGRTP